MAYAPNPIANTWRTTFASVIANNIDTTFWTLLQTGSGQTVNQTGGNLVITTGTTINTETILRSKVSWQTPEYILRFAMAASQRIVNTNMIVELVDVIGDGLAYTINSATSVTVTIPGTTFTSANVGQGVTIGAITGAAGIPMRGVIASVSGTAVTFTVAGWPASGTGTCSLFGWCNQQLTYTGATATSVNYDAQRKGWNSGATAATITSTASPGHIAQLYQDESISIFEDANPVSTGSQAYTGRASRYQNMPFTDTPMFIQIRCLNGTVAPASTTTWTMGFVSLEELSQQTPVVIAGARQHGQAGNVGVSVQNTPSVVVSSGTVTTVSSVTAVAASTPAVPTASAVVTAATNNLTSTKATAGTVYGVALSNTTATPMFFKLYNKASAPVVASDVPVITIPMAANSTVAYEYGPMGLRFGTGIAWACTGAIGDTDATNGVVGGKVFLSYI